MDQKVWLFSCHTAIIHMWADEKTIKMITYVPNNLWGEMIPSIDNRELAECCMVVEKHLIDHVLKDTNIKEYGSKTTASFGQYNLMTYSLAPIQNLYHKMVEVMRPCLPDEPHVMQCWLNVFRNGESIKWHTHWPSKFRVIHGFYCCHVSPSFTEYKYDSIPGKVFRVESKEGLLVFGKSNDNVHQSSPWHNTENPRITIAFDIIPLSTIEGGAFTPNHYIPF